MAKFKPIHRDFSNKTLLQEWLHGKTEIPNDPMAKKTSVAARTVKRKLDNMEEEEGFCGPGSDAVQWGYRLPASRLTTIYYTCLVRNWIRLDFLTAAVVTFFRSLEVRLQLAIRFPSGSIQI
ncbi:hypothetical protein J6590_076804 [Homalodisca vitripennis]|nr:hypothetical protein J6590_076804 [Homalodisca vitripennis]